MSICIIALIYCKIGWEFFSKFKFKIFNETKRFYGKSWFESPRTIVPVLCNLRSDGAVWTTVLVLCNLRFDDAAWTIGPVLYYLRSDDVAWSGNFKPFYLPQHQQSTDSTIFTNKTIFLNSEFLNISRNAMLSKYSSVN